MEKQRHIRPVSTPQQSDAGPDRLALVDVARLALSWITDGLVRQLSRGTLANRKAITDKLLWFLRVRGYDGCGTEELRAFFAYLNTGHEAPRARWPGAPHAHRPLRPVTVWSYYGYLHAFFTFAIEEGLLACHPMRFPPPLARADQVRPFSQEQIEALIAAARRSRHTKRDEAIVRMLLNTGCRASELCSLRVRDVALVERRAVVHGKGNKYRTVYFTRKTARVLAQYLQELPRDPHAPLFLSDRGQRAEAIHRTLEEG